MNDSNRVQSMICAGTGGCVCVVVDYNSRTSGVWSNERFSKWKRILLPLMMTMSIMSGLSLRLFG